MTVELFVHLFLDEITLVNDIINFQFIFVDFSL